MPLSEGDPKNRRFVDPLKSVALHVSTLQKLGTYREHPRESWDAIVSRLLRELEKERER